MNKAYKYTLITMFLALVFTFGSMAGMNLILRAREKQFLTESGRVMMETPIRAWLEKESEEDENTDTERYALTIEQMEEAISCWNERLGITVHNPVTGQISMEEAMKAGEEWLAEMGMEENGGDEKIEYYSMNAFLCIASEKIAAEEQLEPYFSFWNVQFSNQTMSAVLYLNAVTGKVWSADITFYGDFTENIPSGKLEHFVKLSGLQASGLNITSNQEGSQAILQVDDSPFWAVMDFQHAQRVSSAGSLYDNIESEKFDQKNLYNNYVTILFNLIVCEQQMVIK